MRPDELTEAVAEMPTAGTTRRSRWLLPALSAIVVAGIAVAVAVGTSGSSNDSSKAAGAQSSGPAAVPSSREAADAEALRMLGLVQLPGGSVQVPQPPDRIDSADTPPGNNVIVLRTQYWRVPLGIDDVQKWFDAHQPTGFDATSGSSSAEGSSGEGSNGVTTQIGVAYSYGQSDGTTAADKTIAINAIPDGGTETLWRIDAYVKYSP